MHVNWIHLAPDSERLQNLVNTVKIPSARLPNRDPARWISPSATRNRIINTFQHFYFFRHFVLPRIIGVPVNEENKTAFMPTFGQHPVSDSKEPLFVPEAYLKF